MNLVDAKKLVLAKFPTAYCHKRDSCPVIGLSSTYWTIRLKDKSVNEPGIAPASLYSEEQAWINAAEKIKLQKL